MTRSPHNRESTLVKRGAEHDWHGGAHFTREFTDLVGVPPGAHQRWEDGCLGGTEASC